MPQSDFSITMQDGVCRAALFTPEGEGPWPGVLFLMDGLGIRPALRRMGQHLADMGYCVLLPDLFYRNGAYPPADAKAQIADPQARQEIVRNVNAFRREMRLADSAVYLEVLAGRPEVRGEKFGVTGYCMGGNMALVVAAAFAGRIAAAGSFHGGAMATEREDSPHLAVGAVQARLYIAAADKDEHFSEAQQALLEQALAAAGVEHTLVMYEGALHGFAVPDMPVFNADAAERHWAALRQLYADCL